MRLPFALALSIVLTSASALAQDWPQRPVRLILPFAAGGAADVVTRIVMQRVSEQTGQSFFVDNRTGGSGNIGSEMAARAAPDGYTYLVGSPGTLAINPHLFKTLPYDALNDFVPVVHIAKFPQVLAVHGEVKAQTVRDLIALAKAQPGTINYGSSGSGSTGHLITESFLTQAGIKATHVPFRGGAPAVQALLGGTVQMVIDGLPSFTAHLGTGRIRLLGITSAERWPGTPDVPTIAEAAVPGFDLGSWVVIAAPAKTPAEILRRFASEATRAAQVEDVRARLRQAGASAAGSTPEEAMRFQRAEYEKWGAIVRMTGAKAE
ncbi:MAG: tripartite tricarboxylate transporter substrate binding protein [Burkholderiales bacterium]|nr:tripartite tricarboxylate transporter substrate binding protein [Burkholderiales bacterium]